MSKSPLSVSSKKNDPAQLLVSKILSDISLKYNLDLSQDPVALERIREAVDKARFELDKNPQVEIDLPYISANASGPIHYSKVINLNDFDPLGPESAGLADQHAGQDEDERPSQPSVQIKLPDGNPIVTYSL
ncbi:MAG: Hsp70 family protein, partial [Anaerolineales bacterium]|nr:Hsp70 family protein [Anaerolineales bacterium]